MAAHPGFHHWIVLEHVAHGHFVLKPIAGDGRALCVTLVVRALSRLAPAAGTSPIYAVQPVSRSAFGDVVRRIYVLATMPTVCTRICTNSTTRVKNHRDSLRGRADDQVNKVVRIVVHVPIKPGVLKLSNRVKDANTWSQEQYQAQKLAGRQRPDHHKNRPEVSGLIIQTKRRTSTALNATSSSRELSEKR